MSMQDLQQECAKLKMEQHRLEADLGQVKKKLATKGKLLVDQMIEEGVSKVRIETDDGAITLFPQKRTYVSRKGDIPPDLYVARLETLADFADLVHKTANSNSVTARVNEFKKQDREIPQGFLEVAKITEEPTLGTRR